MADAIHINKVIEKEKILFVEGRDELVFFDSLLQFMGDEYHKTIQIIPYEGKAKLNEFLSMISKTEGFIENVSSFAVTRDADMNHGAAIESINSTLRRLFSFCKVDHNEFKETDALKIGVFVFPGKNKSGELEDLVLDAIKGNQVCALVDDYLNGLENTTKPKNESSDFTFPRKPSKAKIQIYFSSMKESDTRLGISAQRKYIDFNHDCFDEIKRFI
ncbi:hypothetical protein VEL94_003705, partial [Cronobacter sakazakii]|nr:hypothetical protein [Cronobacter sakazakii]